MSSKNPILIAAVIVIVFAAAFWNPGPAEEVLYPLNLESDHYIGIDALTCTDGRLSFDRNSPEYKGNSVWYETITLQCKDILSVVVR